MNMINDLTDVLAAASESISQNSKVIRNKFAGVESVYEFASINDRAREKFDLLFTRIGDAVEDYADGVRADLDWKDNIIEVLEEGIGALVGNNEIYKVVAEQQEAFSKYIELNNIAITRCENFILRIRDNANFRGSAALAIARMMVASRGEA